MNRMSLKDIESMIAPGFFRQKCHPINNANSFKIPPYGFIDGFEITLKDPIPHMDAASYYEIQVQLICDGQVVSFYEVFSNHRPVK